MWILGAGKDFVGRDRDSELWLVLGNWVTFWSRRERLGSYVWLRLKAADGRYIVSMSDDFEDLKNAMSLDGKFIWLLKEGVDSTKWEVGTYKYEVEVKEREDASHKFHNRSLSTRFAKTSKLVLKLYH